MQITEISAKEFEKFVKSQSADNFLQSVPMFNRYEKIGKEAYLFGGFIDQGSDQNVDRNTSQNKGKNTGQNAKKKLVAVALCVKMREKLGKKVFNMPRGPILDYSAKDSGQTLVEFLTGVETCLKAKNGMILQVSPNVYRKRNLDEDEVMIEEDWSEGDRIANSLTRAGYKNLGEYEQIKWAYILDLQGKSAEDILMNFRYSHRRNVRLAAEKYGVTVRELKDDEIGVLKEITGQTGERRGFKDPELKYYRDMKEAFSGGVKFLVAEVDASRAAEIAGGTDSERTELAEEKTTSGKSAKKVPVAAAMFLTYGGEKIYLFSGSDRRYKKFAGPHLMQWEVIKQALDEGVKTYNFYGTHPVELPSEKGVYEFKRGFRGEIIEYVGTFAKPLNLMGKVYLSRIKYAKYREMS